MTSVQFSTSAAVIPRRNKVVLGLLACFLGAFGAHWWYLGRRYAWAVTLFTVICLVLACTQFPLWYDNPAFFLVFIPMIDGFIEGVVFSLMPDEKFDRLYHPGQGRVTHTRWGPVLVAIAGALVGATVGMFAIAMVVVYTWTAMGWLDGYVF